MPVDASPQRVEMALQEAARLHGLGEDACRARRDRMLEWQLAYHGIVTAAHVSQRSTIPHDITREAIERILPKLLGTHMSFEYFRDGQFNEPATALAKFYLAKMFYNSVMERTNRDKLIFGRGVRKWGWRLDVQDRPRKLRLQEIAALQALGVRKLPDRVNDAVVLYDGPFCHGVDPFAMTYDTSVDDPHKQLFTFEEFRMTKQELLAEVEQGRFDGKAVAELLTREQPVEGFVQRWRNEAIARKGIDIGTGINLADPQSFALLEGYYPFDINGDGKDEQVLLVSDPGFKVAARLEAQPHDHGRPPYTYDDWMRLTGEFWPVGVAEVLEPVQTMTNIWGNMGLDNLALSVFNMWLKHADSGIPGVTLKVVPNMLVKTQMMDGLQALKPNDATSNILLWLNFWLKRAQEQSGITQFNALGTPELGQTKTALGIQTLKAAAEEFLAFAKQRMRGEAMRQDAFFFLALLQQFMDAPLDFALRGETGMMEPFTADPDELIGNFDWDAVVEQQTPLSRELESRAMEEWVANILKIGTPVNVLAIAIELGKRKGVARPERFLLQPGPGLPPELANMAQFAIGGAGAPLPGQPSQAGGAQPAARPQPA